MLIKLTELRHDIVLSSYNSYVQRLHVILSTICTAILTISIPLLPFFYNKPVYKTSFIFSTGLQKLDVVNDSQFDENVIEESIKLLTCIASVQYVLQIMQHCNIY